jgi:2-keto-3-deoxy-6-phosphogluconate aldolase
VIAVGGSWITPPQAIAAGDFEGITARARAAAGAPEMMSLQAS